MPIQRFIPLSPWILILLAVLGSGVSLAPAASIFVSNFNNDSILRYDSGGASPEVLVPSGTGGLDLPHRSRIAPDGSLLVASAGTDNLLRYDPTTGAYLGEFVSAGGGLDYPVELVFRPDGYLYVSSQLNSQILRFDASTGVRDPGWTASHGSLAGPSGMAFDDVGNLYVSGRFSNNVVRFAADGSFSAVLGTVPSAFGMTLRGDGALLVASGTNGTVEVFSNPQGIPTQSTLIGGLSFPVGIEISTDGSLLIAEYGTSRISMYDSLAGSFLGEFDSGAPLNGPNFITAVPEPSSLLLACGGLLLWLCRRSRAAASSLMFASLLAIGADVRAAGFPNVAHPEAGQLLGGGILAPGQGRTAIIAFHNGVLYSIPESPGSVMGSDYEVRAWDLAGLDATTPPLVLEQLGVTRQPVNAHGYFYRNNVLIIGDNANGGWSFAATGVYGQNTRTTFTEMSPVHGVGSRGALYYPFYAGQTWWSYNPISGNATIERDNVQMASWDHLALTGVIGHPFIFGNLLIYASEQSRTGVAIYDISDLSNPVLLSTLKEGGPGGYWPELWGGDGKLYIVWPYQNNLFNDGAPGFRVVDITDPSDPKWVIDKQLPAGDEPMYAQFQDHYAFIANHKIDLRTMEVVLTLASGANGIDTSQFALPLGNLLITGGANAGQGMAIWVHQTAPDMKGPEVGFHIPRSGQAQYPVTSPISFMIHETLETATIVNGTTFIVRPLGGAPIAGQFTFSFNDTLTFTPDAPLDANTTYEVILPEGGIKDAAGNGMAGYSFTFSTGASVGGNLPPMIESFTASAPLIAPGGSITLVAAATDDSGQQVDYRFDAGDGRPKSEWSTEQEIAFTYHDPGHYQATVQVRDNSGAMATRTLVINVLVLPNGPAPAQSGPVAVDSANRRVWTVNPDADTVTIVEADSLAPLLEIPTAADPRCVALDSLGNAWIACHDADCLQVFSANGETLLAQIATGVGSAPFGIAFSPDGETAYVTMYGSGHLRRYARATFVQTGELALGPTPRALAVTSDGSHVLVTRFISPENHGEVWEVAADTMSLARTIRLPKLGGLLHLDGTANGRGVPNYLASIAISPDGDSAWVAATKPNTERGTLFGAPLDQDNTMRTTVLRIDLDSGQVVRDVDLDNSDSASSLAFSPYGDYLFVTLQGNDQLAVFDTLALADSTGLGGLLTRRAAGSAPQGIAVDPVTSRLYVQNFLGRSLTVFEGAALLGSGSITAEPLVVATVAVEPLAPDVLAGKRLFYLASDPRMSAEGYISCASCHVDGGSDGRVWDFTQRGEGLRNTPELRGRAGMGQGNVHWTANFDEIQDFEHDIRNEFGGSGFLSAEDFLETNNPLGTPKAGRSAELDALAAYLASLGKESLPRSPFRPAAGTMSNSALAGLEIFQSLNCASCHSGPAVTNSSLGASPLLQEVGTLRPTSGQRMGQPLTGIDTPTLLGVWSNAPYFHDGSARTLEEVFRVAGGDMFPASSGTVANGNFEYSAAGNFILNFDRTPIGDSFARLDTGGTLTFQGIDGSSGGIGALEFRYSASQIGSTARVRVNGIDYFVATPPTGNWPQWRPTFWDRARLENVPLLAGPNNTIEIGPQVGWILTINYLFVSTADDLAAAAPHRIVQTISETERNDLLSYLRQLDRDTVIASAILTYWDYIEAGGIPEDADGHLDDPDGNGVPNLLEYAFGGDLAPDELPGAQAGVVEVPDLPENPSFLTISFRIRTGATDLRYIVELSDNLSTWEQAAIYTPSPDGSFTRNNSNATMQVDLQEETGVIRVLERDAEPISSGARRFIRVRTEILE